MKRTGRPSKELLDEFQRIIDFCFDHGYIERYWHHETGTPRIRITSDGQKWFEEMRLAYKEEEEGK